MPEPVAPPRSTAEGLRAEMAPSGILQRFLVEQMALAMDRLGRAAAAEDREEPASLRAQAQAERTFYKAMAEFRRLVKAEAETRAAREDAPPPAKTAAAPSPTPRAAAVAVPRVAVAVAVGIGWPSPSRLVDLVAPPRCCARARVGPRGDRR